MSKDLLGFDAIRRVLTLRVVVQDEQKSKWIWENHLKGAQSVQENGIHVTGISSGDMFEENDRLLEKVEEFENDHNQD